MAIGMKADGVITIGTSVDVGGINTGLNQITKSLRRLQRIASIAILGKALVQVGRDAIEAASDLQEVQNVVDTAFGEMSWKVEEFSKTAITKFGMTELYAKETAGSFMAMGKAMGFTAEEASNMAIELTAATGDFASFFNLDQKYARTALSAIYTGETETIKRYGILLTEANLQIHAQTKGIEGSVKAMDARTKAALRYEYVLETLSKENLSVMGDFEKTSQNWANQVRVLKQLWNEFMVTMGSGLISVLSPVIRVINVAINKLITFTSVLWQILSTLFGFKLQDITKETSSGIQDTADATENLADATSDLGKAAKKYLSPIDDLNRYISQSSSGSSDGAGGLSGIGDIDISKYFGDGSTIELPDIDNLFDLGKWLGDGIANALDNVFWRRVYRTSREFGRGLADFFNGVNYSDLFASVGTTIASALNTAIYSAFEFSKRFDFAQLGIAISEAVNNFFSTFDFKALGETVKQWSVGIWTTIKTALDNIEWSTVFSGIKEFFSGLGVDGVIALMGFIVLKTLLKGALFRTIVEAVKSTVGKAFITGFLEGLGIPAIVEAIKVACSTLGGQIAIGLKNALLFIPNLIGTFFTKTIPTLIGKLVTIFATGAGGTFLTIIGSIVSIIGGAVLSLVTFIDQVKNGFDGFKAVLTVVGTTLVGIGLVLAGIASWPVVILGVVIGVVAEIALYIYQNWETIKSWFAGVGEWISTNIVKPVVEKTTEIYNSICDIISPIVEWISTNILTPIVNFVQGFILRVQQIFNGFVIIAKAIWKVLSDFIIQNVIQPLQEDWAEFKTNVEGIFKTLWIAIQAVWSVVAAWFSDNIINPLQNSWAEFKSVVSEHFSKLWGTIKAVWSGVATWFYNNEIKPLQDKWEAMTIKVAGFFDILWEGLKKACTIAMNFVIDRIEGAINGVINILNLFFTGFNAVVSWAASITGEKWDGVTLIDKVSIPRLATGTVIPPTAKTFAAILGDNNKETEVVSPLSTMKQALLEALNESGGIGNRNNGYRFTAEINRKTLFDEMITEAKLRQSINGNNPFASI